MKKSIYLKSTLMLLVIFIGFAGATYSWFSDKATNEGNRVIAGNLKVGLEASSSLDGTYRDISKTADPVFDYGVNAKPGDEPITSYIKVTNLGNIAMNYQVSFKVNEDGLAGAVTFEIEKVYFVGNENNYTKQTLDGNALKTHVLTGASLSGKTYEIYKVTMSFNVDNTYNLDAEDARYPLAYEFDIALLGWQDNAPMPN